VLKTFGLPERYKEVTFDRELAIKRSDAQFMAIGHPFIDAMLSYIGSYDFSGLTAVRQIKEPSLAGRCGYLFGFVVRKRVAREDGDECLFQFVPVFVSKDGQIDESALSAAVTKEAVDGSQPQVSPSDPAAIYEIAKRHLEQSLNLWDWDDEVECVGMSWTVFT